MERVDSTKDSQFKFFHFYIDKTDEKCFITVICSWKNYVRREIRINESL